jgi:hypothetical protein
MDEKELEQLDFKIFDPSKDTENDLPDRPGNYIVVLRKEAKLPDVGIEPMMKTREYGGEAYDVIYTGISKESLKNRDYHQHFTGNNAGRSTLRKSLGSMMGMKKIPRDANKPDNGKTKFEATAEAILSDWMRDNLLLFYRVATVDEVDGLEQQLIDYYNPPLNIQNNRNVTNIGFRNSLKNLRKNE